MALPLFKSFWPTTVKWYATDWVRRWKAIVDNRTGAVIGIQSQDANGPDGIWAPTPLSAAQIAAPTAAMLADINATYQLDTAPYPRYRSDGTYLIPLDESGEGGTVIPPGQTVMWVSPLTIFAGSPLTIEGGVVLVAGV